MKKSAEITIAVKLYYLMKKTKLKYHHEEKSTKLSNAMYVHVVSTLREKEIFIVQIVSTYSEVQIRLIRIKKSTKNLIVIKLYHLMKKKTLKYHHGENSTKLPYAVYVQNLHPKNR